MDFKSAFDSCSHKILFQKLQNNGYPRELLNTIKLLYKDAKISINNQYNNVVPVKKGVLQGGVLSPTLFNYYINDLLDQLSRSDFIVYCYADDLAV